MTKRERQTALKACTDEMQEILNKPAEETTDEDNSRYDELKAEAQEHKEALDNYREQERIQAERRAELGSLANAVGQMPPRVTSSPRPGTPHITRQHNNFEDDPKGGYRSPRDFLQSVMEAGRGRLEDERLVPLRSAAGSDEQGEYHDSFGGFLVPQGFAPGLLTTSPESDPTRGRTRMVPLMTPSLHINARVDKDHSTSVSGGLRVYRRAEADTVSSSRTEFERVTLNAHSLMGIAYATDEIMTDSPISFAALIADGFGDEFQVKKFKEKLNGTGVGEYEGVNNSPALITVSKETGQAADTIVYENIIKMYARCWGKDGAIWIANHDCLPQLMLLNQSIGTAGVNVWQPSAREGEPSTLLGLPIFFSEHTETVGDAGDILLCNWREYLEAEMGGTNSASSIHVRFVNHEQTFRFSQRNDGRGWWRAALTPDKGSTLSPFVRLAARA